MINGEADVAADFSSRPFDHLLFTGSTSVGKLVMRAAAENLTPVTLELGGKSPAVVSPDVPMEDAAQRIAFGKALNAGQTCVAPDYVLCPADRVQAFVDEYRHQFAAMYPSLRDNEDYTAIINERQYERLQSYLEDAREKGAELIEINPASENLKDGTRKMPITLALKTTPDMKIMQDEIFGPILPIISYGNLDEAIHYINDRPRPLALYFFGYDKSMQEHVVNQTHSGGMCINDALMHVAQDDLPFGGIGDSGMGHYHGKEGFLTFSHQRAIFDNLRGSQGLVGLRGRGFSIRPFEVIEQMRSEADNKFRNKEQELLARIAEMDQTIERLQREEQTTGAILTSQQQTEIDNFRLEMLDSRKELRDVQRSLREDVESLERRVRVFNIWAVPLVIAVLAILLAIIRRIRRSRYHRAVLH